MVNGINPIVKSIWNADDERLKTLVFFMTQCDTALLYWDLEGIYNYLHAAKRVFSGKGRKTKDDSWKNLMDKFKELEDIKRELSLLEKPEEIEKKKIEFYNKSEEIYIELNSLIQKHGFWFREGLDPSKAALRR